MLTNNSVALNKIEVIYGDITKIEVDSVVNAANSSLMGGGGVDGAIHRAGGPSILQACKAIVEKSGPCPTGEAVITTAGNLPARYVIHTVGPVWHGGNNEEPEKLTNCYRNSLLLAAQNGCHSIAFPNISTGVYRYPKEAAAKIALQTILDTLNKLPEIEKVFMVCFDEENYNILNKILRC